MKFDLAALSAAEQYKLLAGTIIPRPIALVGTIGPDGSYNAAPYSFFNCMGEAPPVLVLGLQDRPGRVLKDTTMNIRERGQFVVHLVDEELTQAMGICAIDFPPGEDETAAAGLTLVPCERVRPGRIAEAPVSFECELITLLQISPGRVIAVGKAVMMHARDGVVDPGTLRINEDAYHPIGRTYGPQYIHTGDRFEMRVPGYEEWLAKNPKGVG